MIEELVEDFETEAKEELSSIMKTVSGYGLDKEYEKKENPVKHFTDIAYGLKFNIYVPDFAMDGAFGYTWVNQGMAYLSAKLTESMRTEVGIHEYRHNKKPDDDEFNNRVGTAHMMHNLIGEMEFHNPYLAYKN